MSEGEIAELILMHVDQIQAEHEFWLAISFGVLIATHAARESIGTLLKVAMCVLYLGASMIGFLNTAANITQIVTYLDMVPDYVDAGRAFNEVAAIFRISIYLVGTVGISVLIFKYEKWTR